MPTFIDESGDTGWKPGSLPYFRLGAVWLPTKEVVEACRKSIRAARKKLGLPENFEFKSTSTKGHPERRHEFFEAALGHEFRFAVCGYDKHRMSVGCLETVGFHWGCSVVLATHLRATYQQAEAAAAAACGKPVALEELVIVDDNQDKNFLAEIKAAFRVMPSRTRPGRKLVGKVKFRDSGPDEMLQLVDMVIGAVGAHLDGDSTWYDLISGRSLGVICLAAGKPDGPGDPSTTRPVVFVEHKARG